MNPYVRVKTTPAVASDAQLPSGAPIGQLVGQTGERVGDSPKYNDSSLVRFGPHTYDIHNQWLEPT